MTHQKLLKQLAVVMLTAIFLAGCAPATATPPTGTPLPTPTEVVTPTAEPVWDYVALGDSNPAGYGVLRSYVALYAVDIGKDLGVQVNMHNRAFNGARVGEILTGLQKDPALQQDIRDAEVVTIDVGANDWTPVAVAYPAQNCGGADNEDCMRKLIEYYRENLEGILEEIARLRGPDARVLVRVVDLYLSDCDFPDFFKNKEIFNGVNPYVTEFNAVIAELSAAHGAKVVPLHLELNGPDGTKNPVRFLQEDHCHLSTGGHQKVADLLRELGYDE